MITHHAQAVEMSEIVRPRTEDPDIRILATDIALTQQAQIGQFQGLLTAWGLPIASVDPPMQWMGHSMGTTMPGMATDEEIAELRELPIAKMDAQFLRLMIPHHRGALMMARGLLPQTERAEMVSVAEKTISAQGSEIAQMQDMLEERGEARIGPDPLAGMGGGSAPEHGSSDAVKDILRLVPIALGVFALVWLIADSMHRRQIWAGLATSTQPDQVARYMAVVAFAGSGAIHLGLTPEHLEESSAAGAFFAASGIVLLVVSAWLLAWSSRSAAIVGAAAAGTLIIVYVLSRTTGVPGTEVEPFDTVGIVTKLVEVVALGACVAMLWRRSPRSRLVARSSS